MKVKELSVCHKLLSMFVTAGASLFADHATVFASGFFHPGVFSVATAETRD